MFHDHQHMIASSGKKSVERTFYALAFVQLSIRTHLEHVGPLMIDVHACLKKNDTTFKRLPITQAKRDALRYYWDNRHEIFEIVQGTDNMHALMAYLVSLPGLGIPKAGFVCQLLKGAVGCMDSHNLRLYGLDAKAFRSDGASASSLKERIATYIALCESIGTDVLWDRWCQHVADLRPKSWSSANDVSRFHADCIIYG